MAYPNLGKDVPEMPTAITIAQRLQQIERNRGLSIAQARLNIAQKIRKGVSTVEHLVKGRAKSVDAGLRDALHGLLVRELEQEIGRLTHELEITRQSGAHLASNEISEVEAHLEAARALLKGAAR